MIATKNLCLHRLQGHYPKFSITRNVHVAEDRPMSNLADVEHLLQDIDGLIDEDLQRLIERWPIPPGDGDS